MGQLSSYRQQQADEAYELTQDMLTSQYMWDTVLAYLQSPSFFIWWFGTILIIVGYKAWAKTQKNSR